MPFILKPGLGFSSEFPTHVFDTSWAAHIKGTRAIVNSYDLVFSSLIKIQDDKHESGSTKRETCFIHDMMEIFEFMFVNCISEHFHKTSKILEDPQTTLSTCSKLYAHLSDFMYRSMTDLHVTMIIFLQVTSFNSFIPIMH